MFDQKSQTKNWWFLFLQFKDVGDQMWDWRKCFFSHFNCWHLENWKQKNTLQNGQIENTNFRFFLFWLLIFTLIFFFKHFMIIQKVMLCHFFLLSFFFHTLRMVDLCFLPKLKRFFHRRTLFLNNQQSGWREMERSEKNRISSFYCSILILSLSLV